MTERLPPPPKETPTVEDRIRALRVPDLYRVATFSNYQLHGPKEDQSRQRKARRQSRWLFNQWITTGTLPRIVVYHGGAGTGKDHLAIALVKAIVAESEVTPSVHIAEWAKIMRRIRETWRKTAEYTESAVLHALWQHDILVIRELSSHAFYGSPTQHLMDVIGEREQQRRPTIITTNETKDGLAGLVGDAIADRLDLGLWIATGDTSFRRYNHIADEEE